MDSVMADLIPLKDAQKLLIDSAAQMGSENISVIGSLGRVAAIDIYAKRAQPAKDMSAMDGYAICYDPRVSAWDVIGECRAGAPPSRAIDKGQAARIFTGALLPEGADTIMIQENMTLERNRASLKPGCITTKGQHIRYKGNDFNQDDMVIKAGESITAAKIGLMIAAGHAHISVYKKPTIAIISTGDELRDIGDVCDDYQIPASNGPMIAAMLEGCDIVSNLIIHDDLESLRQCISDHVAHCDAIITIGGASVGDHDLIPPALEKLGADINFMKAAIKPGKPILSASLDNTVVIGLPGNPASAFVTAILFLLPMVRYMMGKADYLPPVKKAKSAQNLAATGKRAEFLRAHVVDDVIDAFDGQDSAKISILSISNALLLRPENTANTHEGTYVDYIPL